MLPAVEECLLHCQLVSTCNSHVSCIRVSCAAAARTAGGCKPRCAAAPSSRREQVGSCTHNGWPAQCTCIHVCLARPMKENCSSSQLNINVLSLVLWRRQAVFVQAAERGGRRCASGGGKRGAKAPSARRPAACSVDVSRCLDAVEGAGRPLPVRVARVRARGRGRGAASAAPSPGKKFTLLWSADPSPELKCQSSSGPCRPAARWPPVQQARSLGVIPPLLSRCSCH